MCPSGLTGEVWAHNPEDMHWFRFKYRRESYFHRSTSSSPINRTGTWPCAGVDKIIGCSCLAHSQCCHSLWPSCGGEFIALGLICVLGSLELGRIITNGAVRVCVIYPVLCVFILCCLCLLGRCDMERKYSSVTGCYRVR